MIFIDGKEYINYKEICKEFNIDYNDFENYMNKNKNISQYELLRHFIPNLKFKKYDSISKQFKHLIYYTSEEGWWM